MSYIPSSSGRREQAQQQERVDQQRRDQRTINNTDPFWRREVKDRLFDESLARDDWRRKTY